MNLTKHCHTNWRQVLGFVLEVASHQQRQQELQVLLIDCPSRAHHISLGTWEPKPCTDTGGIWLDRLFEVDWQYRCTPFHHQWPNMSIHLGVLDKQKG